MATLLHQPLLVIVLQDDPRSPANLPKSPGPKEFVRVGSRRPDLVVRGGRLSLPVALPARGLRLYPRDRRHAACRTDARELPRSDGSDGRLRSLDGAGEADGGQRRPRALARGQISTAVAEIARFPARAGPGQGGAASGQGYRHLAGPGRVDPGGRRLGRLPDRLVSGRVPLASREPESGSVAARARRGPSAIGARARRATRRSWISSSPPSGGPWVGAISDRAGLFDPWEVRVMVSWRSVRSLRPRCRPGPPSSPSAERASDPRVSGLDPESRDRARARQPLRGDESDRRRIPRAGAPGNIRDQRPYSERSEARWTNQRQRCGCPGRRPAGSATSVPSSTTGRRSIACSSPWQRRGSNGEKRSFHIVDPEHRRERMRRLEEVGISQAAARRPGQVEVRAWEESTLRGGRFDKRRCSPCSRRC